MYLRIYLLACVLIFCQCQPQVVKPTRLLSLGEMQKVLVEIHTLEALLLERNYLLIDSAQVAYQDGEKALFKRLKIPYGVYKDSYNYYLKAKPELLDRLYFMVIEALDKREKNAPLTTTTTPQVKTPTDSVRAKNRERKKDNGTILKRNIQQQ